ncbi:hypothetical protein DFH09DRAFT_1069370 [Mycena vulgaris]|nr:hypothetical protein DFH09DRAFT_1069370 [Mycena vulgaris]
MVMRCNGCWCLLLLTAIFLSFPVLPSLPLVLWSVAYPLDQVNLSSGHVLVKLALVYLKTYLKTYLTVRPGPLPALCRIPAVCGASLLYPAWLLCHMWLCLALRCVAIRPHVALLDNIQVGSFPRTTPSSLGDLRISRMLQIITVVNVSTASGQCEGGRK